MDMAEALIEEPPIGTIDSKLVIVCTVEVTSKAWRGLVLENCCDFLWSVDVDVKAAA